MDSISQAALGAALGVAVMGRRTAVWKAAAWGAVAGTLPDLDALIDHGDPVSNMTFHRAESHALFWQTLAAVPLGAAIAAVSRERGAWRRWSLMVWLALTTHALLDAMTVYGTQLLLPFSDEPLGLGSIFIIDLLYTVPLLVGIVMALRRADSSGLAWNRFGLVASTAYLAWSAAAQAWVSHGVRAELQARGLAPERLLVTPTPFNTVLWRVVAVTPDGRYHEGFRSLFDGDRPLQLDAFDQGREWLPRVAGQWHAQRVIWFTRGFYKLAPAPDGTGVIVSDLRMGQEPTYTFAFRLLDTPLPRSAGARPDIGRALRWLGPRLLGADLPPPR
jgi:inner membrane protein